MFITFLTIYLTNLEKQRNLSSTTKINNNKKNNYKPILKPRKKLTYEEIKKLNIEFDRKINNEDFKDTLRYFFNILTPIEKLIVSHAYLGGKKYITTTEFLKLYNLSFYRYNRILMYAVIKINKSF